MKFKNTIDINTPSDWECVATDVIDEFLLSLQNKEEFVTCEFSEDNENEFLLEYTDRAMGLYNRLVVRLDKLGNKIFPGVKFEYNPEMIQDFPEYGHL